MKKIAKVLSYILASASLPILLPISASLAAPGAPSFQTYKVQIVADNSFNIFLGDANGPTRLFYENLYTWGEQIARAATLDVVPYPGETYLYVLAMGGGGVENWGGRINGIDVVYYPGAQVARHPTIESEQVSYVYLEPTSFNDTAPNCSTDQMFFGDPDYPFIDDGFGNPVDDGPKPRPGCSETGGQTVYYYVNQTRSALGYKYLDISGDIAGLNAHQVGTTGGCNVNTNPGCDTVANGGFTSPTILSDVQTHINSSTVWVSAVSPIEDLSADPNDPNDYMAHPNASNILRDTRGPSSLVHMVNANLPSVSCVGCGNSALPSYTGHAWDFPENNAVMFRYPLSSINPGGLEPIIAGNGEVFLNWRAPSSGTTPTGYVVEYKLAGANDTTYVSAGTFTGLSARVTGLTNGTSYTFRVTAKDAQNNVGPASNEKRATPSSVVPSAPTNLTYTNTSSSISVSFAPPANSGSTAISNYEYSTDSGITWMAFSPAVTSGPVTISALSNGSNGNPVDNQGQFKVKLRALNSIGAGNQSSEINRRAMRLRYLAASHGSISGIETQTAYTGESGTAVTAIAASGYHFDSWNDGLLTATRIETSVTQSETFTATFAQDPPPAPPQNNSTSTSVPDPSQQSRIISITPSIVEVDKSTVITLTGVFVEKIRSIQVDGNSITPDSWIQSGTEVTFTLQAKNLGRSRIGVFNGSTPVMAEQFVVVESAPKKIEPVVTPSPTPTPIPTATPSARPKPSPTASATPPLKSKVVLRVFFDLSSAEVKGENLSKLQSLAQSLSQLGKAITINVTGYAQPTPGSEASDTVLSKNRAAAVTKVLQKFGVNTKIVYKGAGRAVKNVPSSRYVEIVAANS
jgi:outer membrane protein OmpA-like peptidoglycan-associated protein